MSVPWDAWAASGPQQHTGLRRNLEENIKQPHHIGDAKHNIDHDGNCNASATGANNAQINTPKKPKHLVREGRGQGLTDMSGASAPKLPSPSRARRNPALIRRRA
eukprot:11874117-Alexandrium_andersonii.AAC.1